MAIKKFLRIRGKRLIPCDKETLRGISNPGAICTHRGIMVINPDNVTFSKEQCEWIKSKINESKDGHKPSDC